MKKLHEYKNVDSVNAIYRMNEMVANFLENTDDSFDGYVSTKDIAYGTGKKQVDNIWFPALYSTQKVEGGVFVKAIYRHFLYDFEFEILTTDDREGDWKRFADKYWPDEDGYDEDNF